MSGLFCVTKVVNDTYSCEWVTNNASLDNSILAARSDKATVITIKDMSGKVVCMMRRKSDIPLIEGRGSEDYDV